MSCGNRQRGNELPRIGDLEDNAFREPQHISFKTLRGQTMSMTMPEIPRGNGLHPISMIVVSANKMPDSIAFYGKLFGWQMHPLSAELTAVVTPSGPTVALRSNVPEGFQGIVPMIQVNEIQKALDGVVASGATVERAPWTMPMIGKLARFADASGTIYGLVESMMPSNLPHVPMPFGDNARPLPGSVCSLELYASNGETAARFFTEHFGWGTRQTMPHFMGFDAGASVGGVFQSHTPALPAVAYVYSADVASALNTIDSIGGKRSADAMSMPGMGTFGYFVDPSGTHMGLIGP